jgi:hypothetical protein
LGVNLPKDFAGTIALRTQRQSFRNDSGKEIEVGIEMWPEKYLLKPGDEILIEAEMRSSDSEVFNVAVTETGLQIYPNIGVPSQVWLNGYPAEENWTVSA